MGVNGILCDASEPFAPSCVRSCLSVVEQNGAADTGRTGPRAIPLPLEVFVLDPAFLNSPLLPQSLARLDARSEWHMRGTCQLVEGWAFLPLRWEAHEPTFFQRCLLVPVWLLPGYSHSFLRVFADQERINTLLRCRLINSHPELQLIGDACFSRKPKRCCCRLRFRSGLGLVRFWRRDTLEALCLFEPLLVAPLHTLKALKALPEMQS